jgi:hypothetical protein
MNMNILYDSVNEYPGKITGTSMIIRMLDGLGYRFRYASEALTPEDYQFSPGQGCKTIGEIVEHIWGLVNWICQSIFEEKENRPKDIESQRIHILELVTKLRTYFDSIDDMELANIKIHKLPFWHIINGPLSDALTHTGQINTLRRLAGNLPVKSDVFRLKKP